MELSSYNGWENKFTWLMHLHLSNEQELMQEIMALVASTYRSLNAQFVAMWVEKTLFNWLTVQTERDRCFDTNARLLAWDLVGSALAYTDWDVLVRLLGCRVKRCKNVFTMTLFQFIVSEKPLLEFLLEMVRMYPNTYECADVMKDWFREQVDTLFDGSDVVSQRSGMVMLVNELLQATYKVVAWKHVARAFRPEY